VQSLNSSRTTYTYNYTNNELTGSSNTGLSVYYSYDPNGNLISKRITSGGTVTWTYSWDATGNLLKATNSTVQALYAYDGLGRKIESVESGANNYYAYQGTDVLFRRILNGDSWAYVNIAGLRLSLVIDGNSRYYFHNDALGSTRMMTSQNSTPAYVNNYQPYGQDNGRPSGSFANNAVDKFTGKPVSQTTGLKHEA